MASGSLTYNAPSMGGDGSLRFVITSAGTATTLTMPLTIDFSPVGSVSFVNGTYVINTNYTFNWKLNGTSSPLLSVPALTASASGATVTFDGITSGTAVNGFDIVLLSSMISSFPFSPNAWTNVLANVANNGTAWSSLFSNTTLNITPQVICYHESCKIKIHDGPYRSIVDLKPEDRVTLYNGDAAVVKRVFKMPYRKRVAMCIFAKNCVAAGVPAEDVVVSENHNVLLNGVSVPAKALAITQKVMRDVEYLYHLHVDAECDLTYVDCSGLFTDVWGNLNDNVRNWSHRRA